MAAPKRRWSAMALCVWAACFSESDIGGDDDAETVGSASASGSTSVTATASATGGTSTVTGDASVTSDSTSAGPGTATGDSSTGDPTDGCPGVGEAACNDGVAVIGELCFLEPEPHQGGDEQIGALAIADLDGDGVPDVAFTDGNDGFVSFAIDGEVQDANAVAAGVSTWSVDVGAVGGQAVVAFGGVDASVYAVRFDGMAAQPDPPLSAPGAFATARFGDLDDDGLLDLVVASEESPALYIYANDGFGAFGDEVTSLDIGDVPGISDLRLVRDPAFAYPGIAMLTRDGRLIWTPPSDSGPGNFVEIDGAQTYGDPNTGRLAAGDLDDDGDLDLAVGFDGRAFVFRVADGTTLPMQPLGRGVTGAVVPAIVDVDNDGLADVLLADPLENEIEVYIAVGAGFSAAEPLTVPAMVRGVGAADFNGDCAADVVALGPAWFAELPSNP